MTKEAFIQTILENVNQSSENGRVGVREVIKRNGTVWLGITPVDSASRIQPIVYLDSCYDEYMGGRETIDSIAKRIQAVLREDVKPEFPIQNLYEYDNVRQSIFPMLINFKENEQLLGQLIHIRILDLAVIFYINWDMEGYKGTAQIRNSMMTIWNLSRQELFTDALQNAVRHLPPICMQLEELIWKEVNEMPGDLGEERENLAFGFPEGALQTYVVSNSEKAFGAGVVLYPDFLAEKSEEWESDIVVLPSSIHETILIPAGDKSIMEKLTAVVKEINRDVVLKEDWLSDFIYLYEKESGYLQRIGDNGKTVERIDLKTWYQLTKEN